MKYSPYALAIPRKGIGFGNPNKSEDNSGILSSMSSESTLNDVILSKSVLYFPVKSQLNEPEVEIEKSGEFAVADTLQISNNGKTFIAFKVLCKHRDRYMVRPNMGYIGAGKSTKLEISRDSKTLPEQVTELRTEFKILTTIVNPAESYDIQTYWKQVKAMKQETKCIQVKTQCKEDVKLPSVPRRSQEISSSVKYVVGNHYAKLDRSIIRFRLPYQNDSENAISENNSEANIRIINVHDSDIEFKVMTTSPGKYFVKPNYGCVKKESSVPVKITLLSEKLQNEKKSDKDKFQIVVRPCSDCNGDYREAIRFTSRIISWSSGLLDEPISDFGKDETSSGNLTYVEINGDSSSSLIEESNKKEFDEYSSGMTDKCDDSDFTALSTNHKKKVSTTQTQKCSCSQACDDLDEQPKTMVEELKKMMIERYQETEKLQAKTRRMSW